MLYIKDQQVETVKQTEKDDEKWTVRMKKYADAMKAVSYTHLSGW